MTGYTVEPHPDPAYHTWYVKEPAPIEGLSPHIIAICNSENDALRVAAALSERDALRGVVNLARELRAAQANAEMLGTGESHVILMDAEQELFDAVATLDKARGEAKR